MLVLFIFVKVIFLFEILLSFGTDDGDGDYGGGCGDDNGLLWAKLFLF